MQFPRRYTVTAALPYANGPVHIGHLAGVYIPADIYARYLRMAGEDVVYICGSDEHGVAITIKARNEGLTPQQLVDKYHTLIKDSFARFGISFDIYSRTSTELHKQTSQDFFLTMYNKGAFIKKSSTQYFDPVVNQFLADRYIVGTCPNCGYDRAYGDQCERCGKSLDPKDLIEPRSAISGETPVLKETEHWYLPLQNYEEWLREWILEEHKDWKTNVIGQCRSWINQGLQERSITRDMDWGVPVPLPGAEGKVLYVWLDAPIGYITAAKEWGAAHNKDWQPYWMDKEGTKLVHFIGKDNIVFHCIIFPVMLKVHGDFVLPDNVPANEFLNIEGDKVSTSRNWAVWLHEYLEDFPGKQDVLRYVLTANMPENKDNDFTWKDFQAKNNNELVAILGNLVNRVIVLTHKYFGGKVPPRGVAGINESWLELEIRNYPEKIGQHIREFHFRDGLSDLMNLARAGNKYLTDTEPWKLIKTDVDATATVLHFSLQLLANLAVLAEPYLPFTAQKLREALGLNEISWKLIGNTHLLEEGDEIGNLGILFEKIEDSVIEQQVAKLHQGQREPLAPVEPSGAQAGTQPNLNISPFKENISFEEFSKLDLRIATVKAAERVPKTDKLLKLTIDLGSEERTVVSGIAGSFEPEQVIGRQVVLVANLAPRAIKGITSQGMILMTENAEGKLVFIRPDENVSPGSEAR